MGKIDRLLYEDIIEPESDRHSNRIKVHRDPAGEVTINFRNMKIVLHKEDEIQEWKRGFQEALDKLGDHFKNDI